MESEYLKHRRALKLKGADSPKETRAKKKEKGEFYSSQIAKASKCEECDEPLAGSMVINPAAVVCHIIPKRKNGGCPSVSTHKNNVFHGCNKCHHNFDNKGAAFVKNMVIFEVLKARVATFYHLIPKVEAVNVPEYFRPKPTKNVNKGGKHRKTPGKGK